MRHLRLPMIVAAFALVASCNSKDGPLGPESGFSAVIIERGECFGTCPIYALSIGNDGVVEFTGKEHVHIPTASSSISADKVRTLAQILAAGDFYQLVAQKTQPCKLSIPDFSSVVVRVKSGDKEEAVSVYHGCERSRFMDSVDWIANSVDYLAGSEAWVSPPVSIPEPVWVELEEQ